MTHLDSPSIQPQQPERDGLTITETVVTIVDDDYRVRRVADRDGRGFITLHDATGKVILIVPGSFPTEHAASLIIAWRTGRRRGLEQRDGAMS